MDRLTGSHAVECMLPTTPCLRFQLRDVAKPHDVLEAYRDWRKGLAAIGQLQMDAAVAIQATLFEELLDLFVIENVGKSLPDGKSVRYACLHEIPRLTGPGVEQPTDVGFDELAKIHPRNNTVRIQQDINWSSAQMGGQSI